MGALTDTTTPGQRRSVSNNNERILYIPQAPGIVSSLDGFVTYPEHS